MSFYISISARSTMKLTVIDYTRHIHPFKYPTLSSSSAQHSSILWFIMLRWTPGNAYPDNTKHLYNISTMLDQHRRRLAYVVQMVCKCFVFAAFSHVILQLV